MSCGSVPPGVFRLNYQESKVDQALTIFISGIGGVFVGMALLYLGILVSAQVTKRLPTEEEKK